MAGEAASVVWIVEGPGAPATLDWAFALCTTGGADCADAPQPVGTGSGTPVTVAFTAPDAATLGTALRPLMLGVVCADGTIGVDPDTALGTCTGAGASGTTARFIVPVVPAGATPDHHPVFAQRRHRAGRRGLGFRRPRRPGRRATPATPVAGCRSSPRHRSAATPCRRRSASSATATTARRSRPRARRSRSSRICRSRASPPRAVRVVLRGDLRGRPAPQRRRDREVGPPSAADESPAPARLSCSTSSSATCAAGSTCSAARFVRDPVKRRVRHAPNTTSTPVHGHEFASPASPVRIVRLQLGARVDLVVVAVGRRHVGSRVEPDLNAHRVVLDRFAAA